MSGRSRILTWGLPITGVVTLVTGTGLVIENRPVRPEEDPPRQPTIAPDAAQIGAIGVSEPRGEAIAIASHSAGVITSVDVAVGDRITAGAALFRIDARVQEADVALRRSQVDVAQADVDSLRGTIPVRRAARRSAEAALASALAGVTAAEVDRDDRANLLRIAEAVDDPRAIASEEIDRRRFALQQAEARVTTAQAGVAEAEARVAEAHAALERLEDPDTGEAGSELSAAIARVDQAQRELHRVMTELEMRTVSSPIDARVLQVNIRSGEYAPASVPDEGLIVLGRAGTTHLRVEIDEVDIPRFDPEAAAIATPRGDSSVRIPLKFVHVEPLVVPKRNLSGRASDLVDTRVLQVVYDLGPSFESPGIGQQFDVFIDAPERE